MAEVEASLECNLAALQCCFERKSCLSVWVALVKRRGLTVFDDGMIRLNGWCTDKTYFASARMTVLDEAEQSILI